eukprot:Gregarina_sp_Pseudo_9__235@NODE_1151_length_1834_cov_5_131476_g1077_i0_p2_GENE_NODE_1151_length_1834_cov_5_131476_g1077_i0NODE_1151_length_1834_cov_5_131476_g1077_i0_p2_ORF_typecomplete_len277_score69_18DUF5339/PF17274_2/0_00033DUF5339/PF17274_2/1_3e03DUF5339/PF17274_2/5_2e02DUF5339/PF17274_2/7_3e02DUF3584/PF12128_8/0_0081MAD/PF05557_13/0_01CCCAP/PF15964_5/0_0061CCCAP/PF15964_5/42ADIP/PF11559_8/0_13ADIP/PF11559_8/4_2e02ADIP/PF11559_8/12ADIP/PF11559_8/0_96Tropomyosin/PF00261_20/0_056Tropomyosin/P
METKGRDHHAAKARYRKATDTLGAQKAKLTSLEQELQMAKTQLDQAKEQIVNSPDELKRAHQLASETCDEAMQKLTEAESTWNVFTEMTKVSELIANFTARLKRSLEDFENASREHGELSKELVSLESEILNAEGEMQRRHEGVASQLIIINQKLEAAKSRGEAIMQTNANAEFRERDIQQRIGELRRMMAQEEECIREAEAENASNHREFSQLRSLLEETCALYQATDAKLLGMQKELTKQQFNVMDELRSEVDSFKSSLMKIAMEALVKEGTCL